MGEVTSSYFLISRKVGFANNAMSVAVERVAPAMSVTSETLKALQPVKSVIHSRTFFSSN